MDVRGTAFQQRVWRALTRIAPGETVSYSDLARRIGSPAAVRAVAQACGANPVAVAVPCHRVVGVNGALTAIAGGSTGNANSCDGSRRRVVSCYRADEFG